MKARLRQIGIGIFVVGWILPGGDLHAGSQATISGAPSFAIVEAWQENGLVFLKSDDGRLYSVPLGSPGVEEALAAGRLEQTSAGSPTVADIVDLLGAGISDETIAQYVDAKRARYDLSTQDMIELKRAGASEAFLQFLIRAGKRRVFPAGSAPRRSRTSRPAPEPYVEDVVPAYSVTYQEGIPYYPYVFPGYGFGFVSYPRHSRTGHHRFNVGHHSRPRSLVKTRHHFDPQRPRRGSGRRTSGPSGARLEWRGVTGRTVVRANTLPAATRAGARSSYRGVSRPVPTRGFSRASVHSSGMARSYRSPPASISRTNRR